MIAWSCKKCNKIAFDLDGVLVDVMTPFCKIFKKRYGYEFPDQTEHNLQKAGSVYAGLLAIVADLFNEMKTMGV